MFFLFSCNSLARFFLELFVLDFFDKNPNTEKAKLTKNSSFCLFVLEFCRRSQITKSSREKITTEFHENKIFWFK